MLDSYLCMQEDLVKDNGHLLVLVLRKSGALSVRTVHKESGTKLQKRCCWNSLRKPVDTLRSRPGNDWDYFSHNHFCKPAQSLRSSRWDMWRVWIPSRENGATRCGSAIKFLIRAKRDQDRHAFGLWWLCSRRSSIATVWRTFWKAITTSQIEQILYGCRISEYCWNWTIFHDERHCANFTISCSGLSWMHSSKRRRSTITERMDPREHQNWARIGSCNALPAW